MYKLLIKVNYKGIINEKEKINIISTILVVILLIIVLWISGIIPK